jgi:hypothetical protein
METKRLGKTIGEDLEFDEVKVRQAKIDSVVKDCKESIKVLTDQECTSVEPHAIFGHLFTITII